VTPRPPVVPATPREAAVKPRTASSPVMPVPPTPFPLTPSSPRTESNPFAQLLASRNATSVRSSRPAHAPAPAGYATPPAAADSADTIRGWLAAALIGLTLLAGGGYVLWRFIHTAAPKAAHAATQYEPGSLFGMPKHGSGHTRSV
jgi:hypothetical protein